MNLSEFLAELADLDAELWVDGEQLRMRASKGRLTPDLHNELVKNKAEILVLLHQRNRSASVTFIPLVPIPRNGHLSLSFAQERLCFLDQLEGPSATYNEQVGLRLSGLLDVGALQRSLGEIVRRHEVLRTSFPTVEGVAVQRIAPVLEVGLPVVELQGLDEGERDAEVRRLAAEEARRPFDLARGPLLRVCLLKLGEEEHGLLLTAHHIVADGWSGEVFIRELSALYQAFSRGLPSPLAGLPIQYADFAQWQRRWLRGEVLEGQLAYWRGQLAGAPSLLELPTDHPRPPVQRFRGATVAFGLDSELTHGLKGLSQRAGVTLFMTLLGAFVTLLSRYSGQEDVVVGPPVVNRNRQETEGLIGFFVNTLVLRVDLAGNPSFEALLGRVRGVALAAYAHQEVPFERVVEALEPERSLSHSPLFQEAEREQVVVEWNQTHAPYPKGRCLHELFEAQVEQTPAAIAAVFENEQLTYWELNHRANQLAHYLRQLGVGPEVLVSVFMERSLEMVIGLYGILKAGGAYVPIDPEYPA